MADDLVNFPLMKAKVNTKQLCCGTYTIHNRPDEYKTRDKRRQEKINFQLCYFHLRKSFILCTIKLRLILIKANLANS